MLKIHGWILGDNLTNDPHTLQAAVAAGETPQALDRAALSLLIGENPPETMYTFVHPSYQYDPATGLLTYFGADTQPWLRPVQPFAFTTHPLTARLTRMVSASGYMVENLLLDTVLLMTAVSGIGTAIMETANARNLSGIHLLQSPSNAWLLAALRLTLTMPVVETPDSRTLTVYADVTPTALSTKLPGRVFQKYLMREAETSFDAMAETATPLGLICGFGAGSIPSERQLNFLYAVRHACQESIVSVN